MGSAAQLSLAGCRAIPDNDISHMLVALPNLGHLSLAQTAASSQAMEQVARMRRLKRLDVSFCEAAGSSSEDTNEGRWRRWVDALAHALSNTLVLEVALLRGVAVGTAWKFIGTKCVVCRVITSIAYTNSMVSAWYAKWQNHRQVLRKAGFSQLERLRFNLCALSQIYSLCKSGCYCLPGSI